MQSGLTPFDLTALRFLVASAVILPFAIAWWPSHLPLHATLSMSIFGPGALYSVLMYFGLKDSSAAYGAVFANGSLPIFTILLGFFFARRVPPRRQLIAVLILVVGAVLIGVPGLRTGGNSVVSAIAFFLAASAVLSIYVVGVKHWQVEPRQALALVSLPNAVLFLPVWFFFLPSTIQDVPWSTVLLQAAFQGLGPGFLAVILFSISAKDSRANALGRTGCGGTGKCNAVGDTGTCGDSNGHRVDRHRDCHCGARSAPQRPTRNQEPVQVVVAKWDYGDSALNCG